MNEKTAERSIELGYGHRVRFSDKVHFGYGTQDKLRIIRKALPENVGQLLGSCWAQFQVLL